MIGSDTYKAIPAIASRPFLDLRTFLGATFPTPAAAALRSPPDVSSASSLPN